MSSIATETVVNAARKAINDAVNHYFTYRVFGDQRLEALDDFISMFVKIQPHLMFTQESMDEIEKQMMAKAGTYSTIMNLTLFFYSRMCTTALEDQTLIDHLVNSTKLMQYGNQTKDFDYVSQDQMYLNVHAKSELVDGKLRNNRFYVMLYVAVLFLNVEPIMVLLNTLIAQRDADERKKTGNK